MNGIPLEHITKDASGRRAPWAAGSRPGPTRYASARAVPHVCMVCLGRETAAGNNLPWGWATLSINTSRNVEPVVLCVHCVVTMQHRWAVDAKVGEERSDLWFKVEERRAAWEVAS